MTEPILEVDHVSKVFRERGGKRFKAVDDLSLYVGEGECVGIVGESGCGKSTLARMITCLIKPNTGKIRFCGEDLSGKHGREMRNLYKNMKMIFQEPRSSFDPRLTLGESIQEAMCQDVIGKAEREEKHFTRSLRGRLEWGGCFMERPPMTEGGREIRDKQVSHCFASVVLCDQAGY